MASLKVKEIKNIQKDLQSHYYNKYNSAVWYDYFSNYDTLGGKFKNHILPFAKKLPEQFDDFIVWAKESIPMWCNGFCYHIYVAKDENSASKIHIVKSKKGVSLYIYDDIDTNKILFEKDVNTMRECLMFINNYFMKGSE